MPKHITDEIKAVFFDHDDTLVNTIGTKIPHLKHVARTYHGRHLSDDDIKEHWGKSVEGILLALFGEDEAEAVMANLMATRQAFQKELFAPTIPILRRAKEAGKLVGIITSVNRLIFEDDLTTHEFPRELLDYTQTFNDTPYHKPDPRVFEPALLWLAERHVRPDEVIYIGDGLHDMEAALGVGFTFLGVETGLITAGEFKHHGAKSIASIGELRL